MFTINPVICMMCGLKTALIFVEPKYNGLRGKCKTCGNNWPES